MIRAIQKHDKEAYIHMASDFYASDAVCHNVPNCHFSDTFDELMHSDKYITGYIIEYNSVIAGYALLMKSFSQEAGGMIIWIDELYIRPDYRGNGLATEFFAYLKNNLDRSNIKRIRLEVGSNNHRAISLYKKAGFTFLDYAQMMLDT